MGDQSTGYTVNLDGLERIKGSLGAVVKDLSEANGTYTAQKPYVSTDFGEFGVDQAWATFDTNWSKELHVTRRAVDELVQKVAATGANYRAAENRNATSLAQGRDR
ncbi:hypothetical protein [Kitasatospora sp. NPDC101183]|uniref:hypothetical protein n=1 Tax=Kitasatospora sp. NPDC101183 TaxID=3364100 RepID=UPI0037FDE146